MKHFILLLLAACSFTCNAQRVCKGQVIDSASGKPVEFANIGIVGKGIGTVSDENGQYQFTLPDSLVQAQVRISMIGYLPKIFLAGNFALANRVLLKQDTKILNEVAVKAKKSKSKILGNHTNSQHISGGFNKNNLGAEIAVKLNIKHPQTHLKKFFVHINSSTLEKALFRLNIYDTDEKGFPKENILKQNIIIEPVEKTGLIEFDLTPYNIFVDKDVFVALEWIKDLGDAKGLMFSTQLSGPTWFRHTSQDKWEKVVPGLGLYVEAAY